MRLKLPNAKVMRLLILVVPLAGLGVLHLATGFGLRDVRALGRYLHHRRGAAVTFSPGAGSPASLTDFLPLGGDSLLVVREGGLFAGEEGSIRALGASQGLLRLFPAEATGPHWAAGTYHRVLALNGEQGPQHVLSVGGAVWEVRGGPDRLVIGVEGADLGTGVVRGYRRTGAGFYDPEGPAIPVALDRWSTFDLSPDGRHILANLPDGKGVAVWSLEDGQRLARWPTERAARILCFLEEGRVLFDQGPRLKGLDAAYADARNRLVVAWVGAVSEPQGVLENFATVLSSGCWPDRRRLAFSDMEGLVRVVDLGPQPRLLATFAPKGRGIPWRLRPQGKRLWVLLKGEETRIQGFEVP